MIWWEPRERERREWPFQNVPGHDISQPGIEVQEGIQAGQAGTKLRGQKDLGVSGKPASQEL